MQKILSIGSEQFLKGVSAIPYYEGLGIFDSATGVDFWRNSGLISAGYSCTDIGSTDITNIPKWIHNYPATSRTYIVGVGGSLDAPSLTGKIYPFLMSTDALMDTVHSLGAVAIRGSLLLNDNLFYIQGNFVGRAQVDRYPALWYDSWKGNTWSYSGAHNIIKGPDGKAYVLDGRSIDSITVSDTTSYTTDALTNKLPLGMIALCGISDGNYLVVGMSSRVYGLSNIDYADYNSSIVFWDCFSPAFNKKYDFSEGPVRKVIMKDGSIIAFVGNNIYELSYDNSPKLVISSKNVEGLTTQADAEGNSADYWNGQIFWGGRNKRDIWSLGSSIPQLGNVLSSPNRVPAGENISCVKGITKDKIYVGTDNSKLYALKSGNTQCVGRTLPLSLNGTFKVEMAKVTFQTGGQTKVSVQDSDKNDILSQTLDGTKKIQRVIDKGTANPIVDRVIIRIDITGGKGSTIKKIDLFGTPVADEYAN